MQNITEETTEEIPITIYDNRIDKTEKIPFTGEMDTDHLQILLDQQLSIERVAFREGPAKLQVPYISTNNAIKQANDIFGVENWSSAYRDLQMDFIEESNGKWKCACSVVCQVLLRNGVSHDDVGYGNTSKKSKLDAIRDAKKIACSDALKRALKPFGVAFGLNLAQKTFVEDLKSSKKRKHEFGDEPVYKKRHVE